MGSSPTCSITSFHMAKQKKKHTAEQISGLLNSSALKECPKCNSRFAKVTESRRVFDGIRRRYTCTSCLYKFTMFEVHSDVYEELKWLRSKVAIIRDALGLNVKVTKTERTTPVAVESSLDIPCDECCHNTAYGCSFDIPEAHSPEAKDCNLFQHVNSGNMLL